jgi:hypothetical protein
MATHSRTPRRKLLCKPETKYKYPLTTPTVVPNTLAFDLFRVKTVELFKLRTDIIGNHTTCGEKERVKGLKSTIQLIVCVKINPNTIISLAFPGFEVK